MWVVGVRLSSRLAVVAVSALALSIATAAASTSGGSVSVLSKRGVYDPSAAAERAEPRSARGVPQDAVAVLVHGQ
jgi:hypothetical protein